MIDFDNILKIMTFDETVEYILPCMQIYSSEMDYLKLKLFQNLEKLFKKLLICSRMERLLTIVLTFKTGF